MDAIAPEKPGMARSTQYVWLALGAFVLFVAAFVVYVRAEKQIDRLNEQRLKFTILAEELRHSSNDLTRMVQTYVVSGDARFKRHYQEIIDIRDGRKPRPVHYHNVYWDLVLADDQRPRAFDVAVPLLELLRQAGVTDAEFSKLREAKTASDRLVRTEYVAMGLVEIQPVTLARRQEAISMLNDAAYRQAKAGIMQPISEFHSMTAERTLAVIEVARNHAYRLRALPLGVGLLLVLLLWRALVVIAREKREQLESEVLLRAVFDHAGIGLAWLDPDGRLRRANPEFCKIIGYSREEIELSNLTAAQISVPDEIETDQALRASLLRGESEQYSRIKHYIRKDGSIIWGNVFVRLVRDVAAKPQSLVVALVDVTRKVQAEEELERYRLRLQQLVDERTVELEQINRQLQREILARQQAVSGQRGAEAMFRFVAENIAEVVWIMDIAKGKFTYISPAVQRLRGFTPAEIMSQPVESALTPESAERAGACLAESMKRWLSGEHGSSRAVTEVDQLHKDGRIVHTEAITMLHSEGGAVPNLVLGISRDIGGRKHAEKTRNHMNTHDWLVSQPSRRLLLLRLQQEITQAKLAKQRVAVLFVALDKFNPAHERFSHRTADTVLHVIADRIAGCLSDTDTGARLDENRFVVVLPALPGVAAAVAAAEKIGAALAQSFVTPDGVSLDLSACIGIALYPDHAQVADDLLRFGDEAMSLSRRAGHNRIEIFAMHAPANISTGSFVHLIWKDAYACGNEDIDDEHRELFAQANRLLEMATFDKAGSEVFEATFDLLLAHTGTHFRHEEALLREYHYTEIDAHANLHQALLNRAGALRQQLSEQGVSVEELVNFLAVEVIAKHMLQEDKKFFPLFASLKNPVTPLP